jgi:hypothetical protein
MRTQTSRDHAPSLTRSPFTSLYPTSRRPRSAVICDLSSVLSDPNHTRAKTVCNRLMQKEMFDFIFWHFDVTYLTFAPAGDKKGGASHGERAQVCGCASSRTYGMLSFVARLLTIPSLRFCGNCKSQITEEKFAGGANSGHAKNKKMRGARHSARSLLWPVKPR